MIARTIDRLPPVFITLIVTAVYLGSVLVRSGFDPYELIRIGSQYQVEHSVEEQGYDGQFIYFIARDPDPETVAPYLDVPAYRYQRILLPLLGRITVLGQADTLPWALVGIGSAAHLIAVAVLARLLTGLGVGRGYALIYGLFPGILLSNRLALPEPLAYLFVLLAIRLPEERRWLKWLSFALALFSKETTILFIGAQLLVYLSRRDWRGAVGLSATAFLPFAVFQGWLYVQFGELGLGSGGALATPFEWIPFMGWLRIGAFGLLPLLVFGVVIVPFVYFPAVWGLVKSVRDLYVRVIDQPAAALLLNAAVIPFLPFSTVREPGGLLRFACGLVLAVLLYAASRKQRRALNYGLLWLVLNAILVRS